MGGQVEANHREKCRAATLVKTVDGQLDPVDVMPAGPQKPRTKAATCESIDDVREQRDSFARGHGGSYQAEKRDGRNDDQNLASYGGTG